MKKLLSVNEVAERVGVEKLTVYGWLRTGKLPAYKFGGTVRITQADFDAFAKPYPVTEAEGLAELA